VRSAAIAKIITTVFGGHRFKVKLRNKIIVEIYTGKRYLPWLNCEI
jgi:hypothetical protein